MAARRAAFGIKALYQTGIVEIKVFTMPSPRSQRKMRRNRKQVCSAGLSGILSALFAMAKIEPIEFSLDFEAGHAAQTQPHMFYLRTAAVSAN
jgi:hypothetical protein